MATTVNLLMAFVIASLVSTSDAFTAAPRHIRGSLNSRLLQSTATEFKDASFLQNFELSGLEGKALVSKQFPTLGEVKALMPTETFQKSTAMSLGFAAMDFCTTGLWMFLGIKYMLPVVFSLFATGVAIKQFAAIALWMFYSVMGGTFGIGMWVTAHECGHGAFSDDRKLQDFVGYLYHSLWLVPYFSWQRSHAVHHANTNHITDGETHVPPVKQTPTDDSKIAFTNLFGKRLGELLFGSLQIFSHLFIGWPVYLLFGITGGPSRGITNHFIPMQFRKDKSSDEPLKELFPGSWKAKVYSSDVGVLAMVGVLVALAQKFGTMWVLAAYGGPYLFVNAWLVGYTWLQHTDVDIPHFPAEGYSYMKGAFHTVDRPYDNMLWGVVDFLHHHIGSTHGIAILFLCPFTP